MNPQTSMALREDVIQRTVYVSDIDQQVTEEQLDCLFIGFGQVYVSSTSSYLFVAESEHEMRARTIYYTNIDTKVTQTDIKLVFEAACGEVYRLRLLGDYHHPQLESVSLSLSCNYSQLQFVMGEPVLFPLL
ncbi:polyadenylate-binding protein-interacting protein 12 isoform X1 [Brassica napus]|uniref:polyadenylate-binding protein-interacting protein 12 isoform X1 n=1 Tax=Brassica napus TaxID=3708 RepID=UPI0006AAC708|nr:polyadenylate-binding protein-interacting protein 12 isoform X1 [Brassica napus]